jgi:acylphosphatase
MIFASQLSGISAPCLAMDQSVFHAEILYSGRVQGVGFRYYALQTAREFEVSGYVSNLNDGRVRLEAEGDQEEVLGFKHEIEDQLESFIRKVEHCAQVRAPRYSGFTIR